MPSFNISMLQTVANGLGELKNDLVFVGGAVSQLYEKIVQLKRKVVRRY